MSTQRMTVGLLIGIQFAASGAFASTITPFSFGFVSGSVNGVGCPAQGTCGTAPAQLSINGSATAGIGVLHSSLSTAMNISGAPVLAYADAEAVFQDLITISSPALTGQTGYLDIGYSLDGIISSSGSDHAFAEVGVFVGPTLDQHQQVLYQSSVTNGLYSFPDAFTFVWGQPFGVQFLLDIYGGTITPPSSQSSQFLLTSGVGTGSGGANFSNTLTVSEFIVTDQLGNVISGAQVDSASGHIYSVVPEPSTEVLCIPAVLLFFAQKRRWNTRGK